MTCEICDGSGTIRVPVRRKIIFGKNNLPSAEIREYPCPECGNSISLENVAILSREEIIPDRELINNSDFIDYIVDSIAYKLGADAKDYVSYKTVKHDEFNSKIRAKLGVLSPEFVKSFEDRVKENSKNIAEIIIRNIINEVRNWRSNDNIIEKEKVIRICYEILDHFERCR